MCGITGFYHLAPTLNQSSLEKIVGGMMTAIAHRGPDDSGAWADESSGISLGFRRLAILDLSPTGHQPMHSANGRYVMIFNGEIYNFVSLGNELRSLGHTFRGTSDTEVMLAAISQWGVKEATRRFNGMFAFALWDRQERSLSLVRDRLGIKPLYYGWMGNTLLFGSELKALRKHPAFQAEVDRDALTVFLRHSYVPAPFSIYRGVYKLPPACILTIRPDHQPGEARPDEYWKARDVIEDGLARPFLGSESDAVEELDEMLTRSVGLRMIADVPLGAFLSGGIDSSAIVALMQKQSNIPVRTFTIGFHEAGFNEAENAKAVAKHLGTDHTELYITQEETQLVVPRLPAMYDEPFSDPSQIPTFLVSEMARRHVTVSLSGDGGDELFGGYNRYFWVKNIWDAVGWAPAALRRIMARGLTLFPAQMWNRVLDGIYPNPGDKIFKLADIISEPEINSAYLVMLSQWKHPSGLVIDGKEPLTPITDPSQWITLKNMQEYMMSLDLITYLPDDILVKVDRASMATSLEARAPFLDDHETVEFAWKLPLSMKIRGNQGKWILRQVLYKYVPKQLIERPKMGFGVPIASWLRGPLRGWAEELLNEDRLRRESFFYPGQIRQKWQEHLEGKRNWQYHLWDVLMFQSWLEQNF